MATHSSIPAWEIPWTEEPGGYSLWGCKKSDKTQQLNNNKDLMQVDWPFPFCSKLPESMKKEHIALQNLLFALQIPTSALNHWQRKHLQ